MEIELVRLQAMHGQIGEDSVDETNETDRQGTTTTHLSPAPKTTPKKGVSSKLKSFFSNKFKKSGKEQKTSA